MTQKSTVNWIKAAACGTVTVKIVFGEWIPNEPPSVSGLVDVIVMCVLLTIMFFTPPPQ